MQSGLNLRYVELLYGTEEIGIYDTRERVCTYSPSLSNVKYREVKLLMPYIAALFDCGIPEGPRFQILQNEFLDNLLKKDFAWVPQTSEFATQIKKNQMFFPLPAELESGADVFNLIEDDYFHFAGAGKRGQPVFAGVRDKFMADIVDAPDGEGYSLIVPEGLDDNDEWYGNVIVKPSEYVDFPFLCENEYIFMTIAGKIGLNVPRTWLVTDSRGVRHYCIERFGIALDENEEIQKENMVDLLGVMGIRTKDKYNVYLNDMFDCAQEHLSEEDFYLFCRSWYYQYFIGNTDIHPRNFSLFIREKNNKRVWALAPLYDIVHLPVYGYHKRCCLPMKLQKNEYDASDFITRYLNRYEMREIEDQTVSLLQDTVNTVFKKTIKKCPLRRDKADIIRRQILAFFNLSA